MVDDSILRATQMKDGMRDQSLPIIKKEFTGEGAFGTDRDPTNNYLSFILTNLHDESIIAQNKYVQTLKICDEIKSLAQQLCDMDPQKDENLCKLFELISYDY